MEGPLCICVKPDEFSALYNLFPIVFEKLRFTVAFILWLVKLTIYAGTLLKAWTGCKVGRHELYCARFIFFLTVFIEYSVVYAWHHTD